MTFLSVKEDYQKAIEKAKNIFNTTKSIADYKSLKKIENDYKQFCQANDIYCEITERSI